MTIPCVRYIGGPILIKRTVVGWMKSNSFPSSQLWTYQRQDRNPEPGESHTLLDRLQGSAVTSRRLIITSYNLAITRFWYPAANNRDSVFTGSKHHMFMKIPVLETPIVSSIYLYKVVCFFVSVQIKGFRHLLMPFFVSLWWHPTVCAIIINWIRVRGVVGNSPLSLITIIRNGFEITPQLFG